MSRCYCKYYVFCLYSIILFSSANSVSINSVLNYEENQDYTSLVLDSTTESALAKENLEIKFTTSQPKLDSKLNLKMEESTGVESEIEATTEDPVETDSSKSNLIEEAIKDSNVTVIIVAVLFAFTMIVKGVPVIVAYAIPYFTNNPITGPNDYIQKEAQKEKDIEVDIDSIEKEIERELEKEKEEDDLKEIKIITDTEMEIVNMQEHKIMQEIHLNLKNDEKQI